MRGGEGRREGESAEEGRARSVRGGVIGEEKREVKRRWGRRIGEGGGG